MANFFFYRPLHYFDLFTYLYACVYECGFVHVAGCNAERAGKGIRLQEVMGHPARVTETELPSSVRALHTLNH